MSEQEARKDMKTVVSNKPIFPNVTQSDGVKIGYFVYHMNGVAESAEKRRHDMKE